MGRRASAALAEAKESCSVVGSHKGLEPGAILDRP